jgi:hypothetical protein
MDHHKGLSLNADVDGFEEWVTHGRRPIPLFIPRFINMKEQTTDFIRGYHFGASASRPRQQGDAEIGGSLKEALTTPGPWRMNVYGYGECLPYADNRVTLDTSKKDNWGRPVITIDCEFKANEKAQHEHMKITGRE